MKETFGSTVILVFVFLTVQPSVIPCSIKIMGCLFYMMTGKAMHGWAHGREVCGNMISGKKNLQIIFFMIKTQAHR